jgi:hypothetical protein
MYGVPCLYYCIRVSYIQSIKKERQHVVEVDTFDLFIHVW